MMARVVLSNQELKDSVDYCKKLPRPRFIKCHQPFNLLRRQIRTGEKKPKIIYVARNPKDVCVSFYHHSKLLEGFCGSFEVFCELFLEDKVVYAPYWNHISGFWKRREQDNFLFITYEDMKKDLPSVVTKTAGFLGKSVDDQQVKELVSHLSFANMKTNSALNREGSIDYVKNLKMFGDYTPEGEFIRNGSVGQWKASMSEDIIRKFDNWIACNLKSCEGLTCTF